MVEFSYIELFFAIVAVYAIAFACGWFSREQMAVRKVTKMFAEVEELEKKIDNRIVCRLEIHHGHFYMFDKESGEFYAQGENMEELSVVLKERFPKKTFVLTDDDYEILRAYNADTV